MPTSMPMNDDVVGYKRPPKRHQFQKGRSGNPRGRARGSRNFATLLRETADRRVRVTIDGKPTTMNFEELLLRKVVSKAAEGKSAALSGVAAPQPFRGARADGLRDKRNRCEVVNHRRQRTAMPHEKKGRRYDVGYRKPPVETQFRKGRSGNPRGRPIKSKSIGAKIAALLDEPVTVIRNGSRSTASKHEAMILQLSEEGVRRRRARCGLHIDRAAQDRTEGVIRCRASSSK